MKPNRLMEAAYRRLGSRYPSALLAFELQSTFLVTAGTVALISLFFDPSFEQFLAMLAVGEVLTAISITLGYFRVTGRLQPIRDWIDGDRSSHKTVEAWDIAVNQTTRMLERELVIPIVLVTVPAAIAAVVIMDLSWPTAIPIFIGGLVAVGYAGILHHFAMETGLRPVVLEIAEQLPDDFAFRRGAIPLMVRFMAALPLINIITGLTVAALTSGGDSSAGSLALSVLAASGVAFTISLELSYLLARSVARPIDELGDAMKRLQGGDLEARVAVETGDEIGRLAAGFNQMASGLAERERLRDAFGTYLDSEVAELVLSDSVPTDGVEAEVSLVFSDVRDFTAFAADAEAGEVIAALNRLFEVIVPILEDHGGHVDKFLGDGVMAVFGAPESYTDHADRAVAAATEIVAAVGEAGDELLPIGVGVNSGTVVAGNLGGGGRLNFSVIGDAVNVAARVEAKTRELEVPLLIAEATRRQLSDSSALESIGEFELRGRDEAVELFAPGRDREQRASLG